MPYTAKQGKAACADYGRMKKGESPRTFKGMSKSKARSWCLAHSKGKYDKSKGRSISRSSRR